MIANTFLYFTDDICNHCWFSNILCTCDEVDSFESSYVSLETLQKQSADVVLGLDSTANTEQQETVEFVDEQEGMSLGLPVTSDPMAVTDQQAVADLKGFLQRPVRILSFTWDETHTADTILQTIAPWRDYFQEARIKNKLHNFSYIRCNLKVKILINASPFYYGAMGVTYHPLYNFTPSTINTSTGMQKLMPFSQRPIVYLYPQNNEGGEMTLPFFNQRNWLSIPNTQDFIDMGRLDFITFTDLQSANGVTGAGVTVQVYAWAEDVELHGSTLSLALQSTDKVVDEYGTGPVSAPASTVATIAGKLKDVPIIGRFARATEIGARAVSSIATIFGFTNVPVIQNVVPYRPAPFPYLASTEISYPNEKLTLDPKNELTIDPTVVGAPNEDPLAIKNLITRESFITRADWATTDAVNKILFYSRVTPFMFRATGDSSTSIYDFTPLALVANLFDGWRGDIIFRFKVIASPYHKGRLMFAFDPKGDVANNLVNSSSVSSAIYMKVLDLGESNDIEIRVPFVQAQAFLKTRLINEAYNVPFDNSDTPVFGYYSGYDNGSLIARVLTKLTAPVASAPVRILCYVRGSEEMEFGNPRRVSQALSRFLPQSMDFTFENQTECTMGTPTRDVSPYQFRVNYGEIVKSLRVLLRRSQYIYTQREPGQGLNFYKLYSRFGKIPPYKGWDPNGIHTATRIIGVGTTNYNFVKTTPLSWLLPCFVAYRGSGVWTFNANSSGQYVGSLSVSREPVDSMTWTDGYTALLASTRSAAASVNLLNRSSTTGGTALTNQITSSGLSVLCPNYNELRMNSTNPGNATKAPTQATPSQYDGSEADTFYLEAVTTPNVSLNTVNVDKYWHAGPDFQPIFFLNVPSYYLDNVSPSPV